MHYVGFVMTWIIYISDSYGYSPSSPAASYAATTMSSTSSAIYESVAEARTTRSFVSTLSTTTPEIDEQKQETIRKEFPDTWLFMNVSAEYVVSCFSHAICLFSKTFIKVIDYTSIFLKSMFTVALCKSFQTKCIGVFLNE
jgi:K+-sensing histidine kinase KdpD